MPVKEVTSQGQYQSILSDAGASRLVVVDFTAAWCGPCQMIKPVFEKLSNQYKHVVFVKVDVDQNQEVAAVAGVSAMPTFQFFKASNKIAELKGANPTQLEALIKQHQGPVDDTSGSGSSSASSSLVPGHSDLTDMVTLNQVDCLNQQTTNNVRNALKNDETFLESDVDEQLIISVPFNQSVKVHSIKIVPKDIAHAPKTIKVYANRLTLGFDETDSVEETQTIELTEKDYEDNNGLIALRFVKFQNVGYVILFVEDNLGGEETTQIKQVVFIGSAIDNTDMSALKKVEHEH
ncbi:Thioredoxin-like protein 1 [Podila epigama]|nr:Thioredoxin-like protein 1 [Podila epigama]